MGECIGMGAACVGAGLEGPAVAEANMESNNGMPLREVGEVGEVGGAASSMSVPLRAANNDATVIVDVDLVGDAGGMVGGVVVEGAVRIFAKSLSNSEALPLGKE